MDGRADFRDQVFVRSGRNIGEFEDVSRKADAQHMRGDYGDALALIRIRFCKLRSSSHPGPQHHGAVLTMFVGNPLSGATMPWQFLAAPWGAIGQLMVPGASGSLIRSLSYFPEASTAQQWWTLGVWALVGVVLALIGHFRAKESMHVPESTLETPHFGKHAS